MGFIASSHTLERDKEGGWREGGKGGGDDDELTLVPGGWRGEAEAKDAASRFRQASWLRRVEGRREEGRPCVCTVFRAVVI